MHCWSYLLLCFVRIVLTLLPQTGYIHPDEYFQSTEILAGRIFKLETYTPWEFNTSLPIRSMFLPVLTIGGPYSLMKLAKDWWNFDVLQPYLLVTIPRIMMTALSFLSDMFIYKMCLNNNTRPWSTLKIWASSHVTLVFLSRTFSNSIELVLFSALLYFVSSSMKLTDRYIRREIELEDQYKKAANAVERVNIVKMQKKIPLHKYNHSFWIGALFALGVFNRPTFMLYALVPMFFWMQRGMFLRKVGLSDFHDRMSSLVPTFIIMAMVIVASDTLFYRGWSQMTVGQVVMTPLNFIAYNMDQSNLARHGLHPWYLHSAVNVPMLFNVLGLGGLYLVSRALVVLVISPWTSKPNLFDFNGLLIFSFAVPLMALSLTPHQEPRFLLPLLVPLVLLLGPFLLRRQGFSAKAMRSFWYAGNVVCVLFFGFFHQGGIYETQHWLHRHIHHERARGTHTHLLYFHTYMPPMSLLALPHRTSIVNHINGTRYQRGRTVFFEDLGSSLQLEELRQRCTRLVEEAQSKYESTKLMTEIFVVFPATLSFQMDHLLMPLPTLRWKHVHKSYPHLSMEDPPDFGDLCLKNLTISLTDIQCNSIIPWLTKKCNQMALAVYQLQFHHR
ncbi:GPI mannosyltransferase 4-like [Daphnia carinata]|uniref:GPI mannosyltransferase 4-like n=1 Tax=Daphnia carinata TaxID=120202 RepID=UPI00257E4FC3|nr:GPI mannosyltransferase 4-like [Daphnia carinata]